MPKSLRIALACALGGAATVVLFHPAPIYDPASWMVWAAELMHRRLALEAGPSWKPLPVIVAAPFTLISWQAAAMLWLWVVRSCAIATSVMLWRLGARGSAGRLGGAIAALTPFLIGDWVQLSLGGGSEPVLMALALGAVEAHLAGRRWLALALASGAGLLRPEVWIFLAAYGAWLLHRDRLKAVLPLAIGAGVQVVGWFIVPAVAGADPFQASEHARAYKNSIVPIGEFIRRTFEAMPWQIWVLAAVGVAIALLRRERVLITLAAAAGIWVAAVGVETIFGFSGIGRYSLPAMVVFCSLAGFGSGELFALDAGRRQAQVLTGIMLAILIGGATLTGGRAAVERFDKVRSIDARAQQVNALIEDAGGIKRLLAICGPLGTNFTYSTTLAWRERQTLGNIARRSRAPGVVLVLSGASTKRQPMPPLGTTKQARLFARGDWSIVKFEGEQSCSDWLQRHRR